MAALPSENVPPRAALSVVLADPLVRLFLVTPPSNLTRFEDLRCAAAIRFERLYEAHASDWHVAAAWTSEAPFPACAVPLAVLGVLARFAAARKLRFGKIVPAAFEHPRADHPLQGQETSWLLSRCGTHVTMAVRTRDRLQAIRALTWPEEAWRSWDSLHDGLSREAMRLDCALPKFLIGTGDIPAEFFANPHPNGAIHLLKVHPAKPVGIRRYPWPALDLRPGPKIRAGWTPASLVVCGCALAITAYAAAQSVLLATRISELQKEVAHAGMRLAARERPVDSVPVTAVKGEQVAAVNSAVRQLNLPWQRILQAIEAATPKEIALLALEPEAKRTALKGTAEAPTADGMLSYITQLKTQRTFHNVLLTRHEVNDQDPMKPFRFQFEVYWREAGE
ncbi:hypothetical protein OR16_04697 [Cupriavidus basilensis OR16]|uniref:Fimbrial assembly family protein n=1 Tax=Cupriavidus basilensis OR16 TaxID=1127483 RepID=H1S031_9BURK|nr:hypothetical protein OR16_04697 [Cupriavidus basilensis OR16]